jgi:hypothetical protein
MSDTHTDKGDEYTLPRFKDKVIYIPKKESKTKEEKSYTISSSFKGIIRLSPNNNSSIYEKSGIQLSNSDMNSGISNYTDSIKLEDTAINTSSILADITKRMLIASDSDGYFVSFRVSELNLEFDNLGVIGITESNSLTLFTNAKDYSEDVFTIDNNNMPFLPHKDAYYSKLYT